MSDIIKLEYPEIVRRRPGQFIGSLDTPKVILREVIDNSIDELYRSRSTNLILIDNPRHMTDTYIVQDNGRGIPIHYKPEHKCTATELAVANLYAGSNFSKDESTQVIGQNGVGVSCTNALSTIFVVLSRITKDNYKTSIPAVKSAYEKYAKTEDISQLFYRIEFNKGIKVKEDAVLLGEVSEEYHFKFDNRCNTITYFIPDKDLFENIHNAPIPYTNFSYLGLIMERYYKRKISVFVNGIEFSKSFEPYKFEFERKVDLFYNEDEYQRALEKAKIANKPINKSIWIYSTFEFDTNLMDSSYEGSVNSLEVNMGVHINLVNAAINYALGKKFNTDSPNLIRGLKIVTVLVCAETIFDAQTKSRLVEIPGSYSELIASKLIDTIINIINKNKDYFQSHMNRVDIYNEMNNQLSSKKFIRQVVNSKAGGKFNANTISKLKDAYSDNRKECELFLVEGDSAGSTLVDVRNPKIHAILSLRGRPLNTMNISTEEMLKNEEMKSIILSIGVGVNGTGSINNCRYSKIIVSADADPDGGVITASLLTFFAKHCTELISTGKVYVALSPIFIQDGNYIYPGDEDKLNKNRPFRRIKGLGELKGKDGYNVFFNEDTRKLVQVTLDGAERAIMMVDKYYPVERRNLMIKLGVVNPIAADVDIPSEDGDEDAIDETDI